MPSNTQTTRALHFLRQAGRSGVHSFELNKLIRSTRAAARIDDLKRLGYEIASHHERLGRSWGVRYVLRVEEKKPAYEFDPRRQVFVYV